MEIRACLSPLRGTIVPMLKPTLTADDVRPYHEAIRGKRGLEVGGPSHIFSAQGALPRVYADLASLDGVNFSTNTVWEGTIRSGPAQYAFAPGVPAGHRYIAEASALPMRDESYDFVLSSHCLEHSANPLKALAETRRVLRRGGFAIYVLPMKEYTFDHRRDVTPFADLVGHFERDTQEDDLSHLPEILQHHDLNKDLPAGTFEQFTRRSLENKTNRCLHHHVFDEALLRECFSFVDMEVVRFDLVAPFHEIILVRKR